MMDIRQLEYFRKIAETGSISEAARLGFKRIIVSGYLGKGGKRPKGIEIVTINSIDQLPRALFVE